uniref:Uncharacterized protein n=1 Tax=Brassica oleracea TaxID=3712 RepID=A0A3P6GG96_BRAOL|nr:unnamed protein product [Brassica oleracea]
MSLCRPKELLKCLSQPNRLRISYTSIQITKKQKSLLMIPPKGLFQKKTSLMLKLTKMKSQMMRLKIETMKMYLKMSLIRQNFTFMLYCLVFEFFFF